jgi:hypothetical protein
MATNEAFVVPHQVVKFRSLKIREIEIDVTNIISLDIFEGLGNFGITGKISMQEWSGFKEIGNVFAGDTIKMEFGRLDDVPLNLEYVIFESYGDMSDEDQLHNVVSFGFCSEWILNASTKKRSKPFIGKRIDEIVTELVENCGGTMNVVMPTQQVLERFVSPYWSPIMTLNYLMNFAETSDGHGGFLLWTDISNDQVNFWPIIDLMEGNYGEVGFEMKQNFNYERSPARILQQRISRSFDVMKFADAGAGRTQLVGFNYDNTEIMKIDERLDEYTNNHVNLGTQVPLNDKYMGLQYRNTRSSFLFDNTDTLIKDSETGPKISTELLRGRLHTKYSMIMADILTMKISSPGEGFQKRVGRTVTADYPSVDDGGTGTNKHYSGTYLINEIRHSVQGSQYLNVVSIISNAYKEIERPDMIDLAGALVDSPGEGLTTNELTRTEQGDRFDSDDDPVTAADAENAANTEEDSGRAIIDNSTPMNQQIILVEEE